MMKKVFVVFMLFVFLACTVGFMQTHTFAALDTNNIFTSSNTFNGTTTMNGSLSVSGLSAFGTITSSMKLTEISPPSCLSTFDYLWADSSSHRVKECDNGGSVVQLIHTGGDINVSDQVTLTHLAAPLPQAQGGTGQNSTATFPTSGVISSSIGTVDATGQTAPITTTNLNSTTLVGGQYEVTWNSKITTIAGATSTLGGLTLTWTDPDNTSPSLTVVATQLGGAVAQSSGNNTTGTVLLGVPVLLNVKAGTNITYAFAYASNPANVMTYNLHIKLKALQ